MSASNQSSNLSPSENKLVVRALRCLEKQFRYNSEILNGLLSVNSYLQLHLANEPNEVFAVLFLDNQFGLLAFEKLFHGTINESAVYPRVVVQKALAHNAAKVIFAHNHPSHNCQPSGADREITRELQKILSIVSVTVVDHIIVSAKECFSFAKHGLI
jgi:DNA repair protein RadC